MCLNMRLGRRTAMALAVVILAMAAANAGAQQVLRQRDIEEGYIQVTGGKVWYRIVGAKQPGIPVLALHGGPGFPSDYLEPLEGLADERPVIFYDQLGCGRSDLPTENSLWTMERFLEEIEFVRQALKLNKIHIIGQSWGAMLGMEYVLGKPEGVVSLVSSGSAHDGPRWEADQQIHLNNMPPELKSIILRNQEAGTTSSAEYLVAMQVYYQRHVCRLDPLPNSLKRSQASMGIPYLYMFGPSEFYCTGTLKGFEQTSRMPNVTIPVLFTAGEFDEARPETVKWFQSITPGSEVVIFANASHDHHLEVTEEYLKVVRDFLKRKETKNP